MVPRLPFSLRKNVLPQLGQSFGGGSGRRHTGQRSRFMRPWYRRCNYDSLPFVVTSWYDAGMTFKVTRDSRHRDGIHLTEQNGSPAIAVPQKRIVICQLCRGRLHKQRNGAWYHDRNSSESCRPGEGSERRATPLEIAVGAES